MNVGAYDSCAVMCGRALEGVCRHYKTKSQYLGRGLNELLERKIVDERFFRWSQQLKKHRNLAAHASGEKISQQDAEDLIDFVFAICDYVFVLNVKFNAFMERKADGAQRQSKPVEEKSLSKLVEEKSLSNLGLLLKKKLERE